MKKLVLIFVLLTPSAFAQKIHITSGIASFTMKNMKAHQKELLNEFPVNARAVEEFPAYWYYELSGTMPIKDNFFVGLALTYGSTGGRIHYQDYSGELSCDQLTRFYEIGPQLGWVVNQGNESFTIEFNFKSSIILGDYDLSLGSRIGDQQEKENIGFTSLNLGIQPGFTLGKSLYNFVGIHLYAGYNLNVIRGELYLDEDDSAYLIDKGGEKVTLDWSGLRLGLGVIFLLN